MESLKPFLSFLLRIWRRPRPIALESSVLAKLPPELILYIAELLPPIAAASFSLCCTPIYSVIADRHLKQSLPKFDSLELLELIERDLPDYIICYYCKKFHAIKYAKRHISSNRHGIGGSGLAPICLTTPSISIDLHLDWYFSFTVFQMAMKRYRQGADTSLLLGLLCNNSKTSYCYNGIQRTLLARIVDNQLLFRKQFILLVPCFNNSRGFLDYIFWICPHYRWAQVEDPFKTSRTTAKFVFYYNSKPMAIKGYGKLRKCIFCTTVFQFDLKDLGERGKAIFLTCWKNLGECRSPQDQQWLSHISTESDRTTKKRVYRASSICNAFEGGGNFQFDSHMTAENWKELLKKR